MLKSMTEPTCRHCGEPVYAYGDPSRLYGGGYWLHVSGDRWCMVTTAEPVLQ